MTTTVPSTRTRLAGTIMVGLGGLLMAANAVRATIDASAFATYLGLPLADPADAGLLHIYALRALFISLLVGALLMARQRRALALLAATAVVMPLGDAYLTSTAGAAASTVGRHLAIAVFLMVTAFLLWRSRETPA